MKHSESIALYCSSFTKATQEASLLSEAILLAKTSVDTHHPLLFQSLFAPFIYQLTELHRMSFLCFFGVEGGMKIILFGLFYFICGYFFSSRKEDLV